MCMCMHAYAYAYAYFYAYVHVYVYLYVCAYANVYVCAYAYICVCACVCAYVFPPAFIHKILTKAIRIHTCNSSYMHVQTSCVHVHVSDLNSDTVCPYEKPPHHAFRKDDHMYVRFRTRMYVLNSMTIRACHLNTCLILLSKIKILLSKIKILLSKIKILLSKSMLCFEE